MNWRSILEIIWLVMTLGGSVLGTYVLWRVLGRAKSNMSRQPIVPSDDPQGMLQYRAREITSYNPIYALVGVVATQVACTILALYVILFSVSSTALTPGFILTFAICFTLAAILDFVVIQHVKDEDELVRIAYQLHALKDSAPK